MRRRQGDRIRIDALELRYVQAVLVDAYRNHLEARVHHRLRYRPPRRVLDRDTLRATLRKRVPQDPHAVRRTGADEHPPRIGHDGANASEIVAQGDSELAQAST